MKDDGGKLRYDLVPFEAIKGLVQVLTFGAMKYSPNGWRSVPDAIERYKAAFLRHYYLMEEGEYFDSDSKLPHIFHMLCNVVFLAVLIPAKRREAEALAALPAPKSVRRLTSGGAKK